MKRILIVVDYQNDFVDGALGFPGAELLDDGISRKIRDYQDRGDMIVYTLDTHQENYLATEEGRNLPVEHCLLGSNGHALYGKTGLLARGGRFFPKDTFGSRDLLSFLAEGGFEEVLLVGLVSNICVLSNAVIAKTALPNARIIVDASCTRSFDPELHEKALDVLVGIQVSVINR